MATNVLRFEFLAADHFSPTAEHVSRKLDTMGERLGAVGKAAAFALGKVAVGGVAAFGFEMVKGVAAATAYQTLQLKTAAVIKSTGNVAHLSVAGIDELAHKLQETSGVEEALIINSENVLATFTNIRNQTGKNNDIYDQATARILDLSVAMGEDLQSATVQVGKALNDPIKGMTALQRVGVTFNATQKEQIKHLVGTGHLMAAQKIILGELNKEFGGAAKAAGSGFGGALARLKDVLEDTFRDMAMKLLPSLTVAANWLAERLPNAINTAGRAFSVLGGWLALVVKNVGIPVYRFLVTTLQSLGTRLIAIGKVYGPPVLSFFKLVGTYIASLVKTYGPPIIGFFKMIGEKLARIGDGKPVLFAVAGAIGGVLIPIVGALVLAFISLATAVWSAVAPLLPFIAIGAAVGAVAYLLIANWQRVTAVFSFLGPIVSTVVHYFRDMLLPALRDAAAKVFPAIRGAIDTVAAAFKDHQDVVRDFGKIFMFIIKAIGVALAILGLLIVKVVIPVIAKLLILVLAAVGPIVRALLTITGALLHVITGIASFVINVAQLIARVAVVIVHAFIGARDWLYKAGVAILTGLIRGAVIGYMAVARWIREKIAAIKAFFGAARTWLLSAGKNVLLGFLDGLKVIWKTITGWIGNIATWIRDHKGPISLDRKLLIPAGKAIMTGFYHGLVSGFGKSWDFVKSVGGKVVSELESALGMAGGIAVQGGGNAANRALGQKMAAFYGWTGNQWAALSNLWMGESGWNNYARNPSSGAFGIPQALPPGKMGSAAAGGDAAAQIAWGLRYIKDRYGSPANAYSQWLGRSPHWYDEGGILKGRGLFGKNTNADERVLNPRQTKWFERAMSLGARSGGGRGHGGVTLVLNAPNYIGSRNDLLDEFNRFARQGRLDAIVRMASR